LVTLTINSLLLPSYGLNKIQTIRDILEMMAMGIREMFFPTCYMTALYFLMKGLSRNWFQDRAWRIILGIVILICVALLSEMAWSTVAAGDSINHFVGFWGFYFLWTLLACILIPLLDRFYSRRKDNSLSDSHIAADKLKETK